MAGSIDDRRADDAYIGKVPKISVAKEVPIRATGLAHFVVVRRTAGAVEVPLPKRRTEGVRVEGVNGVVHHRDIDDVMHATRDRQARDVEYPLEQLAIHRKHKKLSQLAPGDLRGVQDRIRPVGPRT